MKIRPALLFLHRYLGLIAAIPILLMAATGSILVFEAEIDRALHRDYWIVQPQPSRLDWDKLVADAQKAFPKDPITSLRLPVAPDIAAEVSLKNGLSASIDPYTSRVLGTRRNGQLLTTKIHQFHMRFLLGPQGDWITGTSTLILLILSITGIYLWWKRRSYGIKFNSSLRRMNLDSHYALGFWSLLPWLLFGLTGVAMAFEGVSQRAIYTITRSAPAPRPQFHPAPAAGRPRLSIDRVMAAAADALPGANVTIMMFPQGKDGVFQVFLKFPEDRTPAGRSHVAIDPHTGAALWVENSRTAPTGTRWLNLNRPLHTGDILGWPTRILAAIFSFLLVLQTLSGIWMWWPRKSARQTVVRESRRIADQQRLKKGSSLLID